VTNGGVSADGGLATPAMTVSGSDDPNALVVKVGGSRIGLTSMLVAGTTLYLPIGVDGAAYQWTDLHGEGIPGILSEQATGWFYQRNLSPISARPVEFAALEQVAVKPNLALAGGQAQFMDLAGDGQPDLVVFDGAAPGLYEHDDDEGWQPFRPFTARLNRNTLETSRSYMPRSTRGGDRLPNSRSSRMFNTTVWANVPSAREDDYAF